MATPLRVQQNHPLCPAVSSTANNTSSHLYDVFINHRGPDTKKRFAGHLYNRIRSHGIRVFLDNPELRQGDNLTSQIVRAIETASVHVAIFSPRYAESNWCLDELVLMLESGATIIPVFYDVEPADLRWSKNQNRRYTEDLHTLEKKKTHEGRRRFDHDTVEKWRAALTSVADITGFDLKAFNDEEGELVEKIVEHVSKKVKKTRFSVPEYEIGLDAKVKDFEDKVLSQQQHNGKPQVVGIVGLGGVGKTTLAKEFHRKSSSYINSCFFPVSQIARRTSSQFLFGEVLKRLTRPASDLPLNSVREVKKLFEDYEPSLEMIIKYPSLVVLDGVDDAEQRDELLQIEEVLHSNSLILITTRDIDLLTRAKVEAASIYNLNGLDTHFSRKLFCFHAFGVAAPLQGYEYLVDEFLTLCEGLPLSLKVLGAIFYRENDRTYWENQLHRFQQILPHTIEEKLKFSYDALKKEEKHIFLDIARIFIGEKADTAIRIWKGAGWGGFLEFQSLMEKRLVEVDSENYIDMHDHLKDLAKTIAEQASSPRPLWLKTDNNADSLQSLQESSLIAELRRNIDDLLNQSSVIKELRGFMLTIIIMMATLLMMTAMLIWSMPRRH